MNEVATGSKKHLALDTDWWTAMGAACCFLAFALLCGGTTWVNLRGRFDVAPVSWGTVLPLAFLVYIGIGTPVKLLRSAVLVMAIGPVSRILLWATRASHETQLVNEVFVRWLDSALYFAICVYVIHWFKTKIRYV
ncbi:MAG TPA: hypothetical protein VH437_04735 [Terriglobales bacterium]|jgi:hypothetical protein